MFTLLSFLRVRFTLHVPAPHQRGFWRDRYNNNLTCYGLGPRYLMVERY